MHVHIDSSEEKDLTCDSAWLLKISVPVMTAVPPLRMAAPALVAWFVVQGAARDGERVHVLGGQGATVVGVVVAKGRGNNDRGRSLEGQGGVDLFASIIVACS